MKKIMLALLLAALAATTVSAQNVVKILDQTNVSGSWSTPVTYISDGRGLVAPMPNDTGVFYESDLSVNCKGVKTPYLHLSGDAQGQSGIIIDNLISINGKWTNADGDPWCYNHGENYADGSCFGLPLSPVIGGDPKDGYMPTIHPIDIPLAGNLTQPINIQLINAGQVYANSPVFAISNCTVAKQQLCHKDDQTGPVDPTDNMGQGETLSLPPSAIANHLAKHAGDYLGACR